MTDTAKVPRKAEGGRPGRRPLVDDDLADQLLGKAQAQGAELLGPDGLLSQVTKAVLERALAEETGPRGRHSSIDKATPLQASRICRTAGSPGAGSTASVGCSPRAAP